MFLFFLLSLFNRLKEKMEMEKIELEREKESISLREKEREKESISLREKDKEKREIEDLTFYHNNERELAAYHISNDDLSGAIINGKAYLLNCILKEKLVTPHLIYTNFSSLFFVKPVSFYCLKVLFRHGMNIDYKDEMGNTSLHLAFQYGNLAAAMFLLSYGADVNEFNNNLKTPITIFLCKRRQSCTYPIIQALSRGLKVNMVPYLNFVDLCDERYSYEVVHLFLENGYDPNNANKNGDTFFHNSHLRGGTNDNILQFIYLFIEKGFDVNLRNKQGSLPFHGYKNNPVVKRIYSINPHHT